MITAMATTMTMTTDATALYRLTTWLSPAYPVGAFSYSHGIEYAVEAGLITDRASLVDWIAFALEKGAGAIDGPLLVQAMRGADDLEALDRIADLAAALKGTAELALESHQQGDAFATITTKAWGVERLAALAMRRAGRPLAYAVAFGVAAACQLDERNAAALYLQAFAANLISAGVRLVPLGQTDGQLATAALLPVVLRAAERALATPLEEIGAAALGIDWCSMRHETQYTRLFRS